MFHLTFPHPSHHLSSQSSFSECTISDSISESSDNATLLSLSREDLTALGAGPIREDVRVSRKTLEALILRERKTEAPECGYMEPDLGITLKMEISYTDHSHLIGCRGATIWKVMEDTGCHIHFSDSNRMSKDHKRNQVTIERGSIQTVEQARTRVRIFKFRMTYFRPLILSRTSKELSPLIFQFNIPILCQQHYDSQMNPDAHNIFFENLQTMFNVQVTVHPPNKLQQTTVSVKGCEDSLQVFNFIAYFAPGTPLSSVTVESTMEISSVQHGFVRAVNDSNGHAVMMNTGATVIFPDLSDHNIQQIKRSRIYIAGDINSVYHARQQQLLGCHPLRMIFDLADDFQLDWESVQKVGAEPNVNVKLINRNRTGNCGPGSSLPPPIPGRSRTIHLIPAERDASNIFEIRRRILGGHELVVTANIPATYILRSTLPPGAALLNYGQLLTPNIGPLPLLMLPQSPNNVHSPVLSPSFWPPTPFSSPFCSPNISGLANGQDGSGMASLGNLRARQFNMHNNGPMGTMNRYTIDNGMRAERSPEFRGPINLMPDFDLHYHRRAPGFERSNTRPNSQLHSPEMPRSQLNEEMGPPLSTNPLQEKKFLAMKAMYQAKMGNNPRVPTSNGAGNGFSKTHLNLFPTCDKESFGADVSSTSSNNGSGVHDKLSQGSEAGGMMTGGGNGPMIGGSMNSTKKPVGPQAFNLLDFASARASTDVSARDLISHFIQHGLENYLYRWIPL